MTVIHVNEDGTPSDGAQTIEEARVEAIIDLNKSNAFFQIAIQPTDDPKKEDMHKQAWFQTRDQCIGIHQELQHAIELLEKFNPWLKEAIIERGAKE
jgi:hypothetical protein